MGKFDDQEPPVLPAKVVEISRKSRPPTFPYTWVGEAALQLDNQSIIKGLIEPGAFIVIYGPSGSGKSFFTADIAQHIAIGSAWRGRKVKQGLVVYVASEAGASIIKRFVAWRDNRLSEIAKIPLAIMTRGPDLARGTGFEELAAQLVSMQQESELPLVLVVFDTLSRSMPGGDENKSEDMTAIIQKADFLRDQFNCATAFVHHTGKDAEKGARGHSSLFAAADLVLKVMDGEAVVEKVRDGIANEKFPFALEPVEIGKDFDGDAVMTCLLNASDQASKKSSRIPKGGNQQIVFNALKRYALDHAETLPGSSVIPAGVKAVDQTLAIEAIIPEFGGEDPKFRVREKIKLALVSLKATGFIGMHGDYIWI